jgi:hypothetical protein
MQLESLQAPTPLVVQLKVAVLPGITVIGPSEPLTFKSTLALVADDTFTVTLSVAVPFAPEQVILNVCDE